MTGHPLSDAALLIAGFIVLQAIWCVFCENLVNRLGAAWGRVCGQRTRGGR